MVFNWSLVVLREGVGPYDDDDDDDDGFFEPGNSKDDFRLCSIIVLNICQSAHAFA